jgi:hypothetical protein
MVQANANKLSGAAVRAAMNVYTANRWRIYILTATPAVKRRCELQVDLPDVKQVGNYG